MPGRLDNTRPYALGLFRIVIGLLFTCHGAASLFGILGNSTVPAGTWPGWYASVIQLVGGILVLIGLGTRTSAFISSGSMAFAYFKIHQPNALLPIENGGEPAVMFCWALLLLVFTGSGAFALDRLLAARGARKDSAAERTPVTA
jgi:putative oxidoreductase